MKYLGENIRGKKSGHDVDLLAASRCLLVLVDLTLVNAVKQV